MNYVVLLFAAFAFAAQSVFAKHYNLLNAERKSAGPLYQLIFLAAGFLFYAVYSAVADFSFDATVLPYAVGFSICFFITIFAMVAALKTGPVALTSLFIQCSLTLTVVYGFIFWNEPVTPMSIAGLVLFIAALGFCLLGGKQKDDGSDITSKKKFLQSGWFSR